MCLQYKQYKIPLTTGGVKADPDKIRAIQGLKPPTNVSELR